MVKKKRQSKRVSLKDKYKIERKVREHDRKSRKAARQASKNGSKTGKMKKDPGIPNLWPYKEQLLRQMESQRVREEERMEEKKEQVKARRQERLAAKRAGISMEDLASAGQRSDDFNKAEEELREAAEDGEGIQDVKQKKRNYMKELRNVVNSADVILQVVDARDPMSCRAALLESMVLEQSSGKRLVLILNKIDLVPRQVVEKWLKVLRQEFPTVAFKASTQQQRNNLGRMAHDNLSITRGGDNTVGESNCVGADSLLQLLKNYSRNKNMKTAITVGVVGYPNVGKSSLINSLKRQRVVGVSPTPGFTKNLQVVQLDKKVKLIDSPGVLFRDSQHGKASNSLILQNCLDPATIDDPVAPVEALIKRCNPEQLMQVYKIKRFSTPQEFLVSVAHKRGKLTKGGIPNVESAARQVLQDWNAGVVPFFTPPPENYTADNSASAEIVTTWSKEFDLDALMAKEDKDLVENVPEMDEEDFIQFPQGDDGMEED